MFALRWYMMLLEHEIKKRKAVAQSGSFKHKMKPKHKKDSKFKKVNKLKRSAIDPFDELSNSKFMETYGLRKESVKDLIEELRKYIPYPRRSDGIQIGTKVLIALSFYVSGLYQKSLGENALLNTSQKTVSRSVGQVTEALNSLCCKYVKWPNKVTERNSIKSRFHEKFGLPNVIGCLDCMHVPITKPHMEEERFHNKQGFYSLNVMIICDTDLNILCVDPSNSGSVDDCSVWENHLHKSFLSQLADSGEETFLLGDCDYSPDKSLLTPVPKCTTGSPEHHYNNIHMTADNTVKTCINILKARFRCLLSEHPLHYDPVTAGRIVTACCILHNIAVATDTPLPQESMNNLKNRLQQQIEKKSRNLQKSEKEIPETNILDHTLTEGQILQQKIIQRLWEDIK